MTPDEKPHAYPADLYAEDVKTGEGVLPKCVDCDATVMPSGVLCPSCGLPWCGECATYSAGVCGFCRAGVDFKREETE